MASEQNVDFTRIRPSPISQHKQPQYIKPGNIMTTGSSSSNSSSWTKPNQNGTNLKKFDWEANGEINHNEIVLEETYEEKRKRDKIKEDKKIWLCKLIIGLIIILMAIVGTVYFILYYTHPRLQKPERYKQTLTTTQRPTKETECTRSLEEIGFKDILSITCKLRLERNAELARLEIVFKPRYGYFRSSKSVQFELSESTVDSDGWNITMYNQTDDSLDIVITRAPARCDSGGLYTLQLNDANNNSILTHEENIEIKSKVSDVNLQVLHNNKSDSNSFYEISCSAQSACTPAPIMLLGIITDGTSEPIFGVNFTCIIKYNDNDGWTVKCTGTIPQNVYSSLNSIACRPTTGNETVDKEVEISYKICRDCVFKCPDDNVDSYWYDPLICNIFHRCYYGRLYTMPCPRTTYFNAESCSCDHRRNILDVCNEKNERLEKKTKRDKCS